MRSTGYYDAEKKPEERGEDEIKIQVIPITFATVSHLLSTINNAGILVGSWSSLTLTFVSCGAG